MLSLLPALRDGDATAIHDARVATRRMRAALPIVSSALPSDAWDAAGRVLMRAGRALGKARDVDVALDVLDDVERRSPATAAAAGALRAMLRPRQLARRRKLITRLERLDLAALHAARPARPRLPWRQAAPRALGAAIADAATTVVRAIERASGVYFPARAHDVRIALKKLRYLVELLEPSTPGRKRCLKTLRAAQETLGQAHDREVLLEHLAALRRKARVPAAGLLQQVLEAEAQALFETYRAQRPGLLAVAAGLQRAAAPGRGRLAARLLAAGVIALPPAVLLAAARSGDAEERVARRDDATGAGPVSARSAGRGMLHGGRG